MNELGNSYLRKVKEIVGQHRDPVETVEKLAAIDKPSTKGFSLNALTLIDYIDDLAFDLRENDDPETTDEELASEIVSKVKQILTDTGKGDWYKQLFWAEFAYSRLKNGAYSYKIINQKLDVKSPKEARQRVSILKTTTPKDHPKAPDFKLEDIRVNALIVNSSGKTVIPKGFLFN